MTNTADDGPGSLRQAVADAQENDVVTFAEDVRGAIKLTTGEIVIDKAIEVRGPGANLLAIKPESLGLRLLRTTARTAPISISGLTLTKGFTRENGGACIYNDGYLTIIDCAITDGQTTGSAFRHIDARGAAIFNAAPGTLTLLRCTLAGNVARGAAAGGRGFDSTSARGGALYNDQGASASLRNCTLSENAAVGGSGAVGCGSVFCGGNKPPGHGFGGAIANSGDLTVEGCTIAVNAVSKGVDGPPVESFSAGGGVYQTGTARVRSSILAVNTTDAGAPNASGTFQSDGYNLVGDSGGSDGFGFAGDQVGHAGAPLDPKLGALQDNGGPMFTTALLPGSPALDSGVASGLNSDQRGVLRPIDHPEIENANGGDGSDIGAFELQRRGGLLNISTRTRVRGGDNALIAGFIISSGPAKEVIVRGIGPSLQLDGALADPMIAIYEGSGVVVAANDDWRDAETAADIQRTLPPPHEREAALWGVINPGAYTLALRGKDDASGIGVVETYDLDRAPESVLANISTRGFVGTGDDALIGGIIIGPEAGSSTRVVLRAIGPSLAAVGIQDALADPTLDVRDRNGNALALNDDWRTDGAAAEIERVGLAPNDDRESALLEVLSPGVYTAIVRGTGDTVGTGLVEAYDIGPEQQPTD